MFLATASAHGDVEILDTVNYETITTLPMNSTKISALEFAPWDENLLAIGCDTKIRLFDLVNGTERESLDHETEVFMMAFGRRLEGTLEEFLVSRCLNRILRKWNLATNELMFAVKVHFFTIELYVCWYGQLIITTFTNGNACVWSTESGEPGVDMQSSIENELVAANMKEKTTRVQGCRGNDTILSAASAKRNPMILRLLSDKRVSAPSIWEFPSGSVPVEEHNLSGDGTKLFCCCHGTMFVVDTNSMTLVSEFNFTVSDLREHCVNFTGNNICYFISDYGHEDSTVSPWVVYDVETKTVHSLADSTIISVAFSHSQNVILM